MRARELLPWRDFTIETSWPPSVAAIELQKLIGERRFFGGGDMPFAGTRDGSVFRFSRRIAYRNSFLPMIVAVVEPSHHDGARVRVQMRLHVFVMLFMGIWMTGATLVSVMVGFATLSRGQPAGLLALAFPLAGAGMTTIPFAFEARTAEHLLREIYARAPALPAPPETGVAYR
jgi:hypothetical protein